jgi:hypothetical protein
VESISFWRIGGHERAIDFDQSEQLGNGIADASTSAVFSKRRTGLCAKLPPTDANVSAHTILQ